jgi:D-beta-D-heptose 7-phosphate kinase/D-beta-D-heptose 1-phosphate adenosyltransferase
MSALLQALAQWKPFTAVVVGDYMLDQLVYGNAERLSPEAPVPVLHVLREEDRAGGAANVCLDLAAMRATVRAVGVTGTDAAGDALRRLLGEGGVDPSGLVADPSRPTTRKRSLIGLAQHRHPQKMFREDHESRDGVRGEVSRRLLAALEGALAGADVVCVEDYGKGVCSEAFTREAIAMSRRRGLEVFVDPAAIADYSKYRSATVVTPNRVEAALATATRLPDGADPAAFGDLAMRLRSELQLDAAVVTLDRDGALLVERAGEPVLVPTQARQVYDVTGAGDMVLAALAAARANGMGWLDAVRLANAAAGLEVAVFGVQPMPIEAIHREVLRLERGSGAGAGAHSGAEKLRTWQELAVEVAALRREGRTVVFTNGCFDILHAGHLSLLRRAAALGDFLVVAVNSDGSVRRLKGPDRPINTERDRAELLGGLECVGAVVVFDQDTPEELIRAVRPDVLVKGGEYTIDRVPGAGDVLGWGGRVELLPMVEGKSTSGVVRRIRSA